MSGTKGTKRYERYDFVRSLGDEKYEGSIRPRTFVPDPVPGQPNQSHAKPRRVKSEKAPNRPSMLQTHPLGVLA
jgi:hypothetical protein